MTSRLTCRRMGCARAQRPDVPFCERHWNKAPERMAEDYRSTRVLALIAFDDNHRRTDEGVVAEFEIGLRHAQRMEAHIAEALEARGA